MDILKDLNKEQKLAVKTTEGPVIIFAGAGSGKTRILTRRAAYLIQNKIAEPENILAITFTNKAATEMKERIHDLVGDIADKMWISTFHSMCVRILRVHANLIGYDNQFTIYDPDDVVSLLKRIVKSLNYEKTISPSTLQWMISNKKNAGISSDECDISTKIDKVFVECYKEYEEAMFMSNAMDFDDLLLKTKELLKNNWDILDEYQEQFKYVMVDEYQDTNHVQFELLNLLADGYSNICVVGDDDQSIYKFRGADVKNILEFKKEYPSAKKIMMEQNYRSTKNILDAANCVIKNNEYRTEKKLWTSNVEGKPVLYINFDSAKDEADYIISEIKDSEYNPSDIAILYRTNRQSRLLEEACLKYNVSYRIVGGMNFYQRKEIKDLVAYLKVIANPSDEIAIKRIINIPKRGIGKSSLEKFDEYAKNNKITFFDALKKYDKIPGIPKKTFHEIDDFINFITEWQKQFLDSGLIGSEPITLSYKISDYLSFITNRWYIAELEKECEAQDFRNRRENIDEFINKIIDLELSSTLSLNKLLEDIALISETKKDTDNKITMMTLHASKGLEFKKVYIIGMNNDIFPSPMCRNSEDLEEERRLCYVGMTRAMEELTLTSARSRMVNGKYRTFYKSCFISELPKENIICLYK